ncbi:NAD-dependent epimerase/dehydratase family protein [Streptomyces chrestomyceticus]|uniref:NAD-dependent epimerase/dehydratase family protein n=1 Tax=Streptomyces chrestomyceticus TaxID=68185 RepID=UPI0027DCB075|nr:NAD(P)-dependent oxidoreductase [Streptomyces chrestomyceticus]
MAKGGVKGVLGDVADGAATAPRRVVVTGATGFIGSAVVRELLAFPNPDSVSAHSLRLRAVARKPPEPAGSRESAGPPQSVGPPQPDTTVPAPVEWRAADLADPASLRGICEGADVLLHLASDIGRDAERCELVNVRGTAALVGEAVRAGVGRIVQLSTAAVYGAGPHAGPGVGEVEPAPVSPASRTRLAAERPVLEAGGTVLRPGLVLGAGDRWVVPALAELLHRVPARWDGGRGLLSVVAVEDLARLFVRLALAPGGVPGGVYHASHPTPVRNGDLMDTLIGHGVLPDPYATSPQGGPDLSWDACLERLAAVPGRVSARQFALLASDHWYRSDEVWTAAGCDPGPGPLVRLAEAADWYRSHLQTRA